MQFEIHALDRRQQVCAFALEAPSEDAAREAARERGLTVFSVKALEARKLAMRNAAKAKADAERQAFLANKGQPVAVADA